MRLSGALLRKVLDQVVEKAGPNVSGYELDIYAEKLIKEHGATPAFKHYHNFPSSLCVSINDEVVHGTPTQKKFAAGDVVGLDLGLVLHHAYTDSARTVIITDSGVHTVADIERIPPLDRTISHRLLWVTYQSLLKGLNVVRAGAHTGNVGEAVQSYAEHCGYGVVRQLVGHGVGHAVHEEPSIPNFGKRGEGSLLVKNQTIAVEPMITVGDWHVITDDDGWTVRTKDGSLAAHFEHTVIVHDDRCEILT